MIALDTVSKSFSGQTAVNSVSFSVPEGAFLVLLGPSGCGKSTMLRMLAGLEQPTAGRITFGNKVVADAEMGRFLPPAQRGAGLVFQSYALWPHMTVAGNVDWPLKIAGLSSHDRKTSIAAALDMLGIAQLADRYPGEISGGQQQRVALARMIAPKPRIMLFDEPLSNLDATLRVDMRFELLRLHRATGATSVYVTHDQVEAMTMASHVAVMNGGRIEQFGTPEQLVSEPASAFVAGFVGTPAANLVPVVNGKWFGLIADESLRGLTGRAMVRAEHLTLAATPGARTVPAHLVEVVPMAGRRLVTGVMADGLRLTGIVDGAMPIPGSLNFQLPTPPAAIFAATGERLA